MCFPPKNGPEKAGATCDGSVPGAYIRQGHYQVTRLAIRCINVRKNLEHPSGRRTAAMGRILLRGEMPLFSTPTT